MFEGKCIVVGVTGGIAAYKAADLVSRLRKQHADVTVVMTKNAQQFITVQTMETLSNSPVVCDMFARPERWEVEHIALAKRADLFAIVPASANVIAKFAYGLADDFLSTTVLATKAPVLVAPAMNTNMWQNPVTQQNVEILKKRGMRFVGPGNGFLAEGMYGEGRLVENEVILSAMKDILLPKRDLEGKKIMVTAGPTREPLDPVRYLSNRSSGRMGVELACAAQRRGAEVTLLLGAVSAAEPAGMDVRRFETTQDLYDIAVKLAPEMDAVIQAAAPGDFRAESISGQKIKKDGDGGMTLHLVQNPDVAAALGKAKRSGQLLVSFAAETENLVDNARGKLERKNADMVVANDVTAEGAGFDVPTNIATLITKDDTVSLPLMSKRDLADAIFDKMAGLWGGEQ